MVNEPGTIAPRPRPNPPQSAPSARRAIGRGDREPREKTAAAGAGAAYSAAMVTNVVQVFLSSVSVFAIVMVSRICSIAKLVGLDSLTTVRLALE